MKPKADLENMLSVLDRINDALPRDSEEIGCMYVTCTPENCPFCYRYQPDGYTSCMIIAIKTQIKTAMREVKRRIEESQTDLVNAKFSSDREFVTIAGVEYIRRCNK